jgi:hypothetical protein
MSIRNIQNSNIPESSVNKTGKTDAARDAASSKGTEKSGRKESDTLHISGKKFADEISFAKDVLSKIDANRIDLLKQIQTNIKQGVYDSENIQQAVSSRLQNDAVKIESFINSSGETPAENPQNINLNSDKIEFLTSDESVADQISEKIFKDLSNF